MINLLPPADRDLVRRDYRRREIVIVLTGIVSLLAVAVLLAGSIVLALNYQAASTGRLLASLASQPDTAAGKQAEANLKQLNNILPLFQAAAATPSALTPLQAVVGHRSAGITLQAFSYSRADGGDIIEVHGQAATRTNLLAFIAALQTDSLFTKVDSPIANIVKDAATPFTLSLTLKP